MTIRSSIIITLILYCFHLKAQTLTCPSPYVWMDGGSFLSFYDPNQPLSSTNPSQTSIPAVGSGLALMPAINGQTFSPTFYTVRNGNYQYWDGTSWINTGHSTGNGAAVNIGGCPGKIYNLVGGTGQVYVYNGSGNGSLLTTIPNFNGGGPYDIVTDCNCNFYILNTTNPNQSLTLYDPNGLQLCTYSLTNMPSVNSGGGFAIVGNKLFLRNSNGFYEADIQAGVVSFTLVSGFNNSPGDFASCPVCYTPVNLSSLTLGNAQINCVTPLANLIINNAPTTGVSYLWSGPGIVGTATNSTAQANLPGAYSCVVTTGGCQASSLTLTCTVTSNTTPATASLTPSGIVCVSSNPNQPLTVQHGSSSDYIAWSGPAVPPSGTISSFIVNQLGSYTVVVTNVSSGCTASATVQFVQTPTVSLTLSTPSICSQSNNGSPSTVTLTMNGAASYNLMTSQLVTSVLNYSTVVLQGSSTTPTAAMATFTVIGAQSICTAVAVSQMSVVANPQLTLSSLSASICPYDAQQFMVTGADSYTWTGPNLTSINTNVVIANPPSTTVYTVIGTHAGCFSSSLNPTLTIYAMPVFSVTPSSTLICLGQTAVLQATGTAVNFTWSPQSAILQGNTSASIIASPTNTQVFTVVGELNTCTMVSSAVVNVEFPPLMNLSSMTNTMCAYNHNGSPNNITIYPTGSSNYSIFTGPGLVANAMSGNPIVLTPTGTFVNGVTVCTATLVGSKMVCQSSSVYTFGIVRNPDVFMNPPSASVCPGQGQVFTISGATSYSWIPDPTMSVTSPTSMIAYPQHTSFYTVIGHASGCNSYQRNAVLLLLPVPQVTVVPTSATVCIGSSVMIQAAGDGTSYQWMPPIGLNTTVGPRVFATPLTTTEYTVVATLNTCTNSAVTTVSTIPIPTVTAVTDRDLVCAGTIANLKASGADSYFWSPMFSLNTAQGAEVQASPGQKTTYTVNGYNGICTGSAAITVSTLAYPDLRINSPDNAVCKGGSLPLTATGADSYTWLPVSGIFSSPLSPSVTAWPVATTEYTVYGANISGTVECYQNMSYVVSVVQPSQAKISGTTTICKGSATTLFASGGNQFKWTPSTGLNVTDKSGVVASPLSTIIYSVETSFNGYCASTASIMLEVDPTPTVFAGRDTTYNVDEPMMVTAHGSGTLTWIDGEAMECRTCASTRIHPTRNTCYLVEVRNDYNCSSRDEVCIQLKDEFTTYIPNSFTPNGDGLNDVFLIYGEGISQVHLDIFDRWGNVIFTSHDQSTGWDGQKDGQRCKGDVYVYSASWYGLDHKRYSRTGQVVLQR